MLSTKLQINSSLKCSVDNFSNGKLFKALCDPMIDRDMMSLIVNCKFCVNTIFHANPNWILIKLPKSRQILRLN